MSAPRKSNPGGRQPASSRDIAASAVAGILYTAVSPAAAFAYAATLMGTAPLVLAVTARS